jgi:hypothetical protein
MGGGFGRQRLPQQGHGHVPDAGLWSNAIILQTGQIGGSTEAALQNATEIAQATGQQVVVGAGNAIPFSIFSSKNEPGEPVSDMRVSFL